MKKRTLLSWSSGKDSVWALHLLRQRQDIEVVGLVTTVNQTFKRVAMHAIREDLLQRQASAVDLPLEMLHIPHPCSDEEYEAIMQGFMEKTREADIDYMAFGDIFLQDIRDYREQSLRNTGISPLFPLWGKPTDKLATDMIAGGIRSIITCVDPRFVPVSFAGRVFDLSLLRDIPEGVDRCGERGEFHTFAMSGPGFKNTLRVKVGETVERDGFVFTDILPDDHP
jgi:uncharacterized protein (TIGR00290 family)